MIKCTKCKQYIDHNSSDSNAPYCYCGDELPYDEYIKRENAKMLSGYNIFPNKDNQ